jgi:hypothetical protein
VTAFPTLVVLRGDDVLGTLAGVRSTEAVLAFLKEHAGAGLTSGASAAGG